MSRVGFAASWLGLAACGPSELAIQDHERLKAMTEQVASLERAIAAATATEGTQAREIQTLRQALGVLEARAGITPFQPQALKPFPGGARLALPDVQQVAAPGGRAQRVSVEKLVAPKRGAVLAFWATWCVPCISDEELAHLTELRQQLVAHDVLLLPLAVDGLDKVLAHPKAGQWLYPVLQRDNAQLEILPQAFVEREGVNLPLFLVVAPDGEARWYYNRKLDRGAVEEIATAAARLAGH